LTTQQDIAACIIKENYYAKRDKYYVKKYRNDN